MLFLIITELTLLPISDLSRLARDSHIGVLKRFPRVEGVVKPVWPEVLGTEGVVVAVGVEGGRPGGVSDVPILEE